MSIAGAVRLDGTGWIAAVVEKGLQIVGFDGDGAVDGWDPGVRDGLVVAGL